MLSRPVIRLGALLLLFAAAHGGQAYAAMLADAAESGAWTRVDELLNSECRLSMNRKPTARRR